MSRRKYRLPAPPPSTALPSPAEIIELEPRSGQTSGAPVTPLPGSPAPEIVVLHPRDPKPNPDRPLTPSREEIQKLPRWARVAYAARCARRVLPLFRHLWPQATVSQCAALSHAVEAAEKAAATATPVNGDAEPASQAAYTARYSGAATAFLGGKAAELAVRATADEADGNNACASAITTYEALAAVATLGTARILTAPARDLDRISRLAKEQNWTDDTPVPPKVFGPMWDRDPPPWWRDDVLEGLGSSEGEANKPE